MTFFVLLPSFVSTFVFSYTQKWPVSKKKPTTSSESKLSPISQIVGDEILRKKIDFFQIRTVSGKMNEKVAPYNLQTFTLRCG